MKIVSTQELEYLRICELEINFDRTNLKTLWLAINLPQKVREE